MIVIRNFYDSANCQKIANRVTSQYLNKLENQNLSHIGSFLMMHTTNKRKYFEDAKKTRDTFERLFFGIKNPILEIHKIINSISPNYSISLAREFEMNYNPAVIRIHKTGKEIPIHKDNVKYEGREYAVSDIDQQLSCVLHLQESESGGDLIIYAKQWKKGDEQFRNIDFGCSLQI